MNNNFSNQKKQFYDKIGNKYNHALIKYRKKFHNNQDFKKNVINWLFSQDEETRMILCSIENKKFTDLIKKAYNEYDNSKCIKFYIKDIENEEELNFSTLNNSKLVSKNSHDYYLKETKFFNDIIFYQCESPINDYAKYTNYFTFSFSNFLKSNITFTNVCDYFTNDNFLKNPIELEENNKNFKLPYWLYKNNIAENYKYVDYYHSKIQIILFYSLPKLIIALLEQVLIVRYLIYNDTKNLEEILSSIYLSELLQKRNNIINYISPKEKKFSYLYFKIDELAKELYNDNKLADFINEKSIKEKDIFCMNNIEIYFNEDEDLNNIILQGNNFFNKFLKDNTPKDFIEFFMFFHIKRLFTYDDFYFRGIFERIYETYINQNYKDLLIKIIKIYFWKMKEKKRKKRKRKRKKKIII